MDRRPQQHQRHDPHLLPRPPRPARTPPARRSPRLVLADSPRPFAPGLIPTRDVRPRGSALLRSTQILPGIRVFLVPGHTWGQQATLFHDADGRPTVFTPDVMPSRHHIGAAYSLAYDVEPYTSMVTKSWFLEEAAAGGWTLILDHERDTPIVTVQPGKKGWFDLVPVK
ncbi:MAG: hypothetical protein H6811_09915 [Phycisphaeraceae bacterium]|nr:hypothetical protein [Phycisphaeraceae bacterium]